MARQFKLTTHGQHLNNESKNIEARRFDEDGSYTIFYNDEEERVYAVPTGNVVTIERVADSDK